ncbi:adenylate/guanylate cyclase domain-containing protein [Leptolyngbya cf. ectocarpi LEGE 11479]|uniref:Adenylate/guanylate cyclase domain-containing protein n=1 Tax=Leptolyngbya cf. ectocarpi LEGE 11479 TaxID=1828722 RepID=A0A929F996_LEPEC|nr:adenylate/guanylate cyclase domain-containing protein [Leptolyngbya ectocarpi]MBE9069246.1 adenylate/guanylate cyclase domain-containing protein [Leptolyngbya cf. ectocarpi LEGE 11479]
MNQPSNRPRVPAAQSIQTAVQQVIAKESLSNELKVAYVKVVVVLISSILDVIVFCFPHLIGETAVPPTVALLSVSACIIYTGLLLALRQPAAWRWLPKLQIAIPLFDSLLIALFITNISNVLGDSQPQIITNVAAFCCLLAVSGGIRIRRQASAITTVLALANFAYGAYLFGLNPAVAVFALFTILGTGLMGMLTSGIVRRQGKNEAGRLLMQQFLPANVVEAAFETPAELIEAPMTFDVTVMVTDLRGFTRYAEKLEPAAVFEFLNQFQGLLSTIVKRHGGWVTTFMGDGMLAVFGAPKVLDNHADKAVQAAQAILAEITKISPLPIGIGLHSGSIVAGCLGTDGHLEFSVIGDTVNVASRLESLTKEVDYSLLISKATQQRLHSVSLKFLGAMPIRGRDKQIEVFVLPLLVED